MKKLNLLLITALIAVNGIFSQTANSFRNSEKLNLKTFVAPIEETYSGIYTIMEGSYYRIGVEYDPEFWVGESVIISQIDATTYRWENWGEPSGWSGNVLYFQIDSTTSSITYPAEWQGVAQTLNGQPITTVDLNPDDLSNVIPLAGENINTAMFDENENKYKLNMVYGYYTAGSGPREFYCLLEMELGVASNPIATQTAKVNEYFNFTVPEGTFVAQGGGTLDYTATLSDDSSLPTWLVFDAPTRTFSGTPTETDMLEIKVTASNMGASTSEIFTLLVYDPESFTDIKNPPAWEKANEFGHTESTSRVIGAVADNYGYLYTFGKSDTASTFLGQPIANGVFLAKHDLAGNVLWLKQFSNCENGSIVKPIVVDTITNNVYITGYITEEFIIPDADNLIPESGGSAFIIKYNTDGTFDYAIKENIESSDLDLAVDNDGNVILTAVFFDTVVISGNSLTSAGSDDVLIAKYNASGVNQWAIRAGGEDIEYFGFCTTDINNNIYLSGEFTSENITVNQMSATFNEHDGNTILSKINPDGETQWIKNQAGSALSTSDYRSWRLWFKYSVIVIIIHNRFQYF